MAALTCPQCGAPSRAEARFCPYCGVGFDSGGPRRASAPPQPDPPKAPPPPGWVVHENPWFGFRLVHPPGWRVYPVRGRISVREDAAGLVSAWIWAVQLPDFDRQGGDPAVAARQIASYYVSQLAAQDPTVRAWTMQGASAVTLRVERVFLGQPLEGLYSVVVSGGSAMLSGYECPRGQAQARAPVMSQILSSFSTIPALPRRRVVEPAEQAFAFEIPEGWGSQAGVNRGNVGGKGSPQFAAGQNPHNTVAAAMPSYQWNFIEGGWGSPFGGLLGGMGGGVSSMPHTPAAPFCERFIVPWMRSFQAGLSVLGVEDRPDLTAAAYQELAETGTGSPASMEVSSAVLTTAYVENGAQLQQRSVVAVFRPRAMSSFGGAWTAALNVYYRAPQAEFDRWEPVLLGLIASFHLNPRWQQGELALAQNFILQSQMDRQRRLGQIAQTLSQTSDIITSGYWSRQETYDRLSQMWSNAILGRQDMTTASGQVYNVPAGYDRYWVNGLDNVYAGGWNDRPDIHWQPLEPTGI